MTEPNTGPRSYRPQRQTVEMEAIPPFDFWGLMRLVWHGKWLILLTMIGMIGLAGYYAFHMTQARYAATATLKVDVQPTTLREVSSQWPAPGTDLASLNTEVAILTSSHVLGQVVTSLNLLEDPEFNRYLNPVSPYSLRSLRSRLRNYIAGTSDVVPDAATIFEKTIQNLRSVMTAARPRDTYILQITAQSGSARKAALLANTAAEVYVADQIRAKDAASQAALGWLTDRVAELRQQLHLQETAVTAVVGTAQIQDESALDALSNQVLLAEQQLDEAKAGLALMAAPVGVEGTSRGQATMAQQQDVMEKHQAQRNRLQTQLATQSAGLMQLRQMQREADATRVLYEAFLARLQETRIQHGLEQSDSQLIAPATSSQYVGPRKMYILAIAALLGAIAGLGLVLLQHGLRRGFLDAMALRDATGLPVIAQFSRTAIRNPKDFRRKLGNGQATAAADAIHRLRATLSLGTGHKPPAIILATSSVPDEGKTGPIVGLAHALAHAGHKVLLIDADQAGPGLKPFLGAIAKHSIGDILRGDVSTAGAITRDDDLQCDILISNTARSAADVFLHPGFAGLITDLKDRYDHILIDAPPVHASPDARVLAQYADAILYTVRWAKTPQPVVTLGLRALEEIGAPVTGLVLSNMNMRKMRQWGHAPFAIYQGSAVPL